FLLFRLLLFRLLLFLGLLLFWFLLFWLLLFLGLLLSRFLFLGFLFFGLFRRVLRLDWLRRGRRWGVVAALDAEPADRAADLLRAIGGDLCLPDIQVLQRFQRGEVLDPLIGHRGPVDVERRQLRQAREVGEPGVGDLCVLQSQPREVYQ